MKNILLFGAGKSTRSLIDYLLEFSQAEGHKFTVVDIDIPPDVLGVIRARQGEFLQADIHDDEGRSALVEQSDIVVSMLPASLHILLARDCLTHKKHLVTASYVSDEMRALTDEAERKGLLFLNECGLDPGIDHMSAMKVIDRLREQSLELTAFETFTGGLLAPDVNSDNPWEYKFTWNPRNVVLAGQGVVKFIQEGKYKYIPYNRIFRRTEQIFIPGFGHFEGYANRDSLKYLDLYGLRGIRTLFRGTLRRPGFCRTWDIFVKLGATDDTYLMEGVSNMSHREFINSFLQYNPRDSIELKLAHYLGLDMDGPEMDRLRWTGFFEDEPVGLTKGTPAQVLEHILKKRWMLSHEEKDMIVMWHKFNYIKENVLHEIHSTMAVTGDNGDHTAMAKTVGLPVGIAVKLILNGLVNIRGVKIPIYKELYNPILEELSKLGFIVTEKEVEKP